MADIPLFIRTCDVAKAASFDTLAKILLERNVAYAMVPSKDHEQELLAAASLLLLKNLLKRKTVDEMIKQLELLDLFTLTQN